MIAQSLNTFFPKGSNSTQYRVYYPSVDATCENEKAMSETSILERMAAGEEQALSDCMNQYGKLIWSVICRFCRIPAERDDAMQEICVEIWRSAGRYNPEVAKETTFLTMIARRRMIDRLRKEDRKPPHDSLDDIHTESRPQADSAPDHAEIEIVDRVLCSLPADQQTAIKLSVVHGYSHSEIAERTNMPIGTVKTHIRRGLILLRERLSEQGGAL